MKELIHSDVCILGAGPAGLSCAMFLAQNNIPCIVLEKEVFPRDKICGDALSGKVVSVLKKLFPETLKDFNASQSTLGCYGINFIAPNLSNIEIPFKKDFFKNKNTLPSGFVSKRLDFDNYLFQKAKSFGQICIEQGQELLDIHKSDKGYKIESINRVISSKLVIDCSGAQSKFVRKVVNKPINLAQNCAGLRVYYHGVSFTTEGNFLELYFLKNLLPGYFWIFPLPDGQANVGLGIRSDFVSKNKINLKAKLKEVIETIPEIKKRFENATPLESVKGFGLPLGSKRHSISGDHYMLCGDAASLIDPFTGEGISNAMISGMYAALQAAECIKSNDYSAKMMKNYDIQVYKRLGPELQISTWLQRLVQYPWLFNFIVKKANSNKELRETISCMFDDVDLRKKFTDPKFYFRLLFG